MTRPYVLTRSAAADLRSIVRYTVEQWGEARCRTYVARIETTAGELALGKGTFKRLDALLPGLRARRAGRHHLF
jgi:plasmid stabilization system protein ParE